MVSELSRTALTLGVVALVAVGGAWVWTLNEAAVVEDASPPAPLLARVIFEEEETRMETASLNIPADGVISFPNLAVDLKNVTFVTVFLHIEMNGPAPLDTIVVEVTNPAGVSKNGDEGNNPTLAGYSISRAVIADWRHTVRPKDIVYNTTDVEQAAAWSAANHTNTRAVGAWEARVEVTPGALPLRTGNVSLSFVFKHYTGTAVLEDPRPPVENGLAESHADTTLPAARSEDVSRTFFTGAGLGRFVDRGPGPHGPL